MASNFLEQWRKAGRKINHSGFDLTSKKVYTSPFGLIQCPLFAETNPNEHFELNVDGFMRTETMNTAAFADGKLITSLFFVPYSQIWHNFNSFVTQKDDRHSASLKGLNFTPTLHLYNLHLECFRMYVTRRLIEGFCRYYLDKSEDYYIDVPGAADNALVEIRNEIEMPETVLTNSFLLRYIVDMHGIPYVDNYIRALQFFKFGSPYLYIGEFDKKLNALLAEEDVTWAIFASSCKTAYDYVAENYFDYHTTTDAEKEKSMFWQKYVNIFRPAAYQHIFYDYFRNKYFDELPFYQSVALGAPKVRYIDTFNFDDLVCDTFGTSLFDFTAQVDDVDVTWHSYDVDYCRFLCLFDLHYRQYKHDIYTSALNATQFGAVSSVSFDGSPEVSFDKAGNFVLMGADGKLKAGTPVTDSFVNQINSSTYGHFDSASLFGGADIFTSPIAGSTLNDNIAAESSFSEDTFLTDYTTGDAVVRFTPSALAAKLKIPSLFDVLQLRRAELMQQWKQNALRAGNMVDDNFKAHYGIEPYYESDNNVMVLGSWEAPLECKPVVATASTGDAMNGKVGDLAATGVASAQSHTVRFKSHDFGVIVGVTYFLPDVYYSANGIDQNNMLVEPFDFYSEEFENIGFENLPFAAQSIAGRSHMLDNLGFVPPYTRYKTAVDEVYGEFSSIGSFDGSMRAWTMQREDTPSYMVNGVMVRDKSAFYVDPRVSDSLFSVHYNGKGNTDPISCFYKYEVKALRPMSVLGIPIFS